MSAPSMSSVQPIRERSSSPSLLTSRTLWGGLAVIAMWLAVLFVGVFGENIVKTSAGGGSSSVPVVTVVALFALLGTVAVARQAFRASSASDDLRTVIENEQHALEQLAAEVSDLQRKLPS